MKALWSTVLHGCVMAWKTDPSHLCQGGCARAVWSHDPDRLEGGHLETWALPSQGPGWQRPLWVSLGLLGSQLQPDVPAQSWDSRPHGLALWSCASQDAGGEAAESSPGGGWWCSGEGRPAPGFPLPSCPSRLSFPLSEAMASLGGDVGLSRVRVDMAATSGKGPREGTLPESTTHWPLP